MDESKVIETENTEENSIEVNEDQTEIVETEEQEAQVDANEQTETEETEAVEETEEVEEEIGSMDDFMDEIDHSMKRINRGDVVTGTIITVNEDEVIVNIGYIADGVIPKEELIHGLNPENEDIVKVGDEIKVLVIKAQDSEGNVVVSERRAREIVAWDVVEKAFKAQETISVTVKQVVNGGVVAMYDGMRCFIPGSQLSYRYVEDMSVYVGKSLEVKIIDFDIEKKRVVLSRKQIEVADRVVAKAKMWDELEEGDIRKGVVTKLMKFGAFVDLGGVEGLIHLDELAWNRVNHPSEVVSEGDEVEVYIISLDQNADRIGLGLKKIEDDPWNGIASHYEEGDLVGGKVVRLTKFGAFVEIEAGIDGLVHISEISSERITKPEDVLKTGQEVDVIILKIDEANRKLSLSIKEAEGQVYNEEETVEEIEDDTTLGDVLGDKLKDFFK